MNLFRAGSAVEFFEEPCLELGFYAHACVGDLEGPAGGIKTPQAQCDPALRGVFQGVAEQIAADLPELERIAFHLFEGGIDLDPEAKAGFFAGMAIGGLKFAGQLGGIDDGALGFRFALGEPGKIEEVIQQIAEVGNGAPQGVSVLFAVGEAVAVAMELEHEMDGVDGVADFVRNGVQQAEAGVAQGLQLGLLLLGEADGGDPDDVVEKRMNRQTGGEGGLGRRGVLSHLPDQYPSEQRQLLQHFGEVVALFPAEITVRLCVGVGVMALTIQTGGEIIEELGQMVSKLGGGDPVTVLDFQISQHRGDPTAHDRLLSLEEMTGEGWGGSHFPVLAEYEGGCTLQLRRRPPERAVLLDCQRRQVPVPIPPLMDPSIADPTLPPAALALAKQTRNPIRKMYYWTLHWATTRYAVPMLALLAFAESSFFPIPPDVLLIALCFATPAKWVRLALMCTAASVAGGALGYYIGFGAWDTIGQPIVRAYHGEAVMEKVRHGYDAYGFFGVLVAAITPIPYKVFTIASGVFHFDFWQFMSASAIGRGCRFFVVAGMIGLLGERVRPFIEKKLEWLMLALGVAGGLGFLLLKYLH